MKLDIKAKQTQPGVVTVTLDRRAPDHDTILESLGQGKRMPGEDIPGTVQGAAGSNGVENPLLGE